MTTPGSAVPASYQEHPRCKDCAHVLRMTWRDAGDAWFCHLDASDRPIGSSAALEGWEADHWVDPEGTCDHWRGRS